MIDLTSIPLQPFVGPRPFEARDRGLFFGREREAHEISSLLLATKIFILYAASGSGKTSLFNAGIRPLLEEELEILPTARFQSRLTPENPNVANVYTYAILSGWAENEEFEGLARATLTEFLTERPRQLAEPTSLTLPRLLVFDQFEELFTTHPDRWPQRRQFLEQLAEASDADPDLRVLIVIRDDYLARLLGFAETLFSGLKDRYFLEPLRKSAAKRAIAGPVRGANRTLEPRAIDDLVQQLITARIDLGDERIVPVEGEYVEPVLLQVVCQTLWKALPADVLTITREYVRDLADVDVALGRFYSDAVRDAASLGLASEGQIRTWIEQKLVTHPGGTRGTVYAGGKSIEGLPTEVVNRLEGKLLRAEFRAGARWLEITHDSLLAPIERSNAEFFRSSEQPLGERADRQMADQLATLIRNQWQQEAALRRLNDPYPLPIRWVAADQALAAPWSALVRVATSGPGWPAPAASWAAGPRELAGRGNQLADVLARIPTGRLVVLGEPGSGKTVLMIQLVLELLARRKNGDRVPVLLSVASWDPMSQDLRSWIATQLATHYGLPAGPHTRTSSRAVGGQSLLDAGLIIPILDGLDEFPEMLRASAITGINNALRPGDRIVVTSRSSAYWQAATGPGIIISAAAVIQLEPPSLEDAAAYLKLSAGSPASAARWDPVLQWLESHTSSAQILRSPLMISLARTIYNVRPGESSHTIPDPAELLNEQIFSSPDQLSGYFLEAFISAAYRESKESEGNRYRQSHARRWLAFLARFLEIQRTTQLAWWQFKYAAPNLLAPLTVGILCGIIAGTVAIFRGHTGIGFGAGILAGLVVGLFRYITKRRSIRGRLNGRLTSRLVGGVVGGAVGGLATGLAGLGNTHPASIVGGLPVAVAVGLGVGACSPNVGGLAGGLVGGFTAVALQGVGEGLVGALASALAVVLVVTLTINFNSRAIPAARLRWSMPVALVGGLAMGLIAGLVAGFAGGPVFGLVLGVALAIASTWPFGLVGALADLGTIPSPHVALVRDVRVFWTAVVAAGIPAAIFGLVGSALSGMANVQGKLNLSSLLSGGLAIGIASGLVVGLTFGICQSASPFFLISRILLSLRRQLPWRLMSFLDDAHQRGILRQSGAVYEFRHLQLQHHLARIGEVIESGSQP